MTNCSKLLFLTRDQVTFSFLSYLPFCPIQFDVTSCQGVLFSFCMVMMVSGLVLAIALPYGYVR